MIKLKICKKLINFLIIWDNRFWLVMNQKRKCEWPHAFRNLCWITSRFNRFMRYLIDSFWYGTFEFLIPQFEIIFFKICKQKPTNSVSKEGCGWKVLKFCRIVIFYCPLRRNQRVYVSHQLKSENAIKWICWRKKNVTESNEK